MRSSLRRPATDRTGRGRHDHHPTTLSRAAGVAAVVAGLIFIGVQINHPHCRRHHRHHHRSGRPRLPEGADGRPGAGRHHRHVPAPGAGRPACWDCSATCCSAPATCSSCAPPSSPRSSCPSRETDPAYVNDVLAAATNGAAIGDIGLLQTAIQVQGIAYLAGGLVFGIALYRARVLARWAAALLAVGGVVSIVLSVLPDAFYRFLAFPNGIAMIGLGYSLWRIARTDTTTLPAPADSPRWPPAGAE